DRLLCIATHQRAVGDAAKRPRPCDPANRLEQARLARAVRPDEHGDAGGEREIERREHSEVVEFELLDERDVVPVHRPPGQLVRTGISKYKKSPPSLERSVAGFNGSIVSSDTSAPSTASTP